MRQSACPHKDARGDEERDGHNRETVDGRKRDGGEVVDGQRIGPQHGHQGRNAKAECNGNPDKEQHDKIPEKEQYRVELFKKEYRAEQENRKKECEQRIRGTDTGNLGADVFQRSEHHQSKPYRQDQVRDKIWYLKGRRGLRNFYLHPNMLKSLEQHEATQDQEAKIDDDPACGLHPIRKPVINDVDAYIAAFPDRKRNRKIRYPNKNIACRFFRPDGEADILGNRILERERIAKRGNHPGIGRIADRLDKERDQIPIQGLVANDQNHRHQSQNKKWFLKMRIDIRERFLQVLHGRSIGWSG